MIWLILLLFGEPTSMSARTCQPVDGEHITMRDLAAVEPRFLEIDPTESAGFAPEPGATRVFWPLELSHIAARNGLVSSGNFEPVCFVRRTKAISSVDIEHAVHAWLPEAGKVTVIEQSRLEPPAGELVIPHPTNVQVTQGGLILLHGYVRFGAGHRFPIWARVQVDLKRKIAVAREGIMPGIEIRPDQLDVEERTIGLAYDKFAESVEQVAGRALRRHIEAGTAISLADLEQSFDVLRDAPVKVEVRNGGARLVLDGVAQANARTGEMLKVRNPSSGKIFQARVIGKNAALVMPKGATNLKDPE